jgi:hypothetical protein
MEPREAADPGARWTGNRVEPQERADRARSWDRWAGIAGLTFIVLDLLNRFTPETPDPQAPMAAFTAQLAADLTGHQLSLWLGFLADAGFLAFLAGLWSRLRRFEGPDGPFATLFLLAGAANVAVLLVARGLYLTLVQYGSTSEPDASTIKALSVLGGWVGSASVLPALVSSLAIAAAILTTGALPRWLGWLAAATAAFSLLSLAWFIQTDTDGVLGIADATGSWLTVAWFLATSLVLLLRAGSRPQPT